MLGLLQGDFGVEAVSFCPDKIFTFAEKIGEFQVISALAQKKPHVPFRDSKITRLLEVNSPLILR